MKHIRSALFALQSNLTRRNKQLILLALDILLPPAVLLLSVMLMRNGGTMLRQMPQLTYVLPAIAVAGGIVAVRLGLPRIQLKSYETSAMMRTGIYAAIMTAITALALELTTTGVPVAGIVIYGLMLFLASASVRIALLSMLLWAGAAGAV